MRRPPGSNNRHNWQTDFHLSAVPFNTNTVKQSEWGVLRFSNSTFAYNLTLRNLSDATAY